MISFHIMKKGLLDASLCPRCGEEETALHTFRDCAWVRTFALAEN